MEPKSSGRHQGNAFQGRTQLLYGQSVCLLPQIILLDAVNTHKLPLKTLMQPVCTSLPNPGYFGEATL